MSPVPVDPHPDFVNGVTVADGDQVDARFKALYDALDPAQAGIDNAMVATAAAISGSKLADASVTKAKLEASALHAFLQLLTSADVKLEFGTATANFQTTELLRATPGHSLGGTPQLIFVTLLDTNTAYLNTVPLGCSSRGTTQFDYDFLAVNGVTFNAGSHADFLWAALG